MFATSQRPALSLPLPSSHFNASRGTKSPSYSCLSRFFFHAHCTYLHTHAALLPSSSVSLSYFIFAVPMRNMRKLFPVPKTLVHEFPISYSHTV